MTYTKEEQKRYGIDMASGLPHYRAYVGVPHDYSLYGASCFNLLTSLGLREHHYALDVGCGSLRLGRILIPYMLPGRYGAVDPDETFFNQALDEELGREFLELKKPAILHNNEFDFPRLREPYDFAIAHSIFSHASLRQIGQCLEKVRGCLADDGIFAATWCPVPWLSKMPEHAADEWVYPGLTFYHTSTIKQLAQEKGLYYQPVSWNTFIMEQVWGIFTKRQLRLPRPPHRAWSPPWHQITRRWGNLLYRVIFRAGLAGKRRDFFPGAENKQPTIFSLNDANPPDATPSNADDKRS